MKYLTCPLLLLALFSCTFYVDPYSRTPASYFQKQSCVDLLEYILRASRAAGISKNDIKIPEDVIRKQTKILDNSMKKNGLSRSGSLYISQSSRIYTQNKTINVKFANDEYLTEIGIFGFPEKIDGKLLINIRQLKYQETYFGYNHQVLERISLDDLWDLISHTYISDEVLKDQLILLPSQIKGINGRRVFDTNLVLEKIQNKVKVRSPDGKIRYVSYKEIFDHNITIPDEDVEIISNFFKNGGRGKVVQLDVNGVVNQEFNDIGTYIEIDKLPKTSESKIFFDKYAFNEAQKMLDENIPLYLTTSRHCYYGAVCPADSSIAYFLSNRLNESSRIRMIVTPLADESIFIHEKIHYLDILESKMTPLSQWFEMKYKNKELPISLASAREINVIVLEQRAYAKELEFLETLKKRSGFVQHASIAEGKKIPYAEYAQRKIETSRKTFVQRYLTQLYEILTGLDHKPEFREELIEVINRSLFKSEHISLEDFFEAIKSN